MPLEVVGSDSDGAPPRLARRLYWLPAALVTVPVTFAVVKIAPQFVFNVHIENVFGSAPSSVLPTTGPLPEADETPEHRVYKEALACIASSCIFERCLATYSISYPFGPGKVNLTKEAGRAADSPRCKPAWSGSQKPAKCIRFNGEEHCG